MLSRHDGYIFLFKANESRRNLEHPVNKRKELTMREHLSSIAKIKTPKKAAASRENGKKGGRKPKAQVEK